MPAEDQDHELLRRYAEDGSHEAFRELVHRHVALVHSAALRQMKSPHDAEDVTQAVFVALAKNASRVRREQVVAGWLVTATRHLACNAKRQAARRRRHEQRAAEMNPTENPPPPPTTNGGALWEVVGRELDEALGEVGDKNRDAIVLRYFEGKSVREVADALQISEDAAKQRLSRALERLRGVFSRRGVTITATALAATLAANAVQAAPTALADATAALTVQCAKLLAMKNGAWTFMTGIKTKFIICTAAAVLAGGTTVAVAVRHAASRQAQHALAAAPPAAKSWRATFQEVYGLAPGETIKRVPPPFIPEREAYFNEVDPKRMFDVSEPDMSVTIFVDRGEVEWRSWAHRRPTVAGVIAQVTGLPAFKLDVPLKDKLRPFPGDYVLRDGASDDDKMGALAKIFSAGGWKVKFEKRVAEHGVIVARGTFEAPKGNEDGAVQLFIDGLGGRKGMAAGDVASFVSGLGDMLETEVVNETENPKTSVFWANYVGGKVPAAGADKLLANVAKQTGLTFTREQQKTTRWVAVPVTEPARAK